MADLLDSVRVTTPTTGTGSVAVGAADPGFLTPAEAGAEDQGEYIWRLEDGENLEIFVGTYSSSGPSVSRDTVIISKIGGTVGTSKINLSGLARLSSVPLVQWFRDMFQANLHLIGLAGAADFRAGTADDKALTPKTAYDASAEVTLTYANPLVIDFSQGTNFVVTLQGSPEIQATGLENVAGKMGRIRFIQDQTGNREPTWDGDFVFSNGEAPEFSSSGGSEDRAYYDICDGKVYIAFVEDVK